jgi:asparaginyl-tRNA synthetase
MDFCYIEDIARLEGERATIKGWLQNKSSKGKIHFLWIRDGTGIIQGVMVKGEVTEEVFGLYDQLTQESSLEVTGTVRKDSRAPGGYELTLSDVRIVQVAQDYPITPKSHGSTFLFDRRHLYLRSRRPHAILKVRDELIWAIRKYFYDHKFVLIDTPILTGAVGDRLLSRGKSLSGSDRSVVFRGGYSLIWKGFLFWPYLQGGEIEDQKALNRILDD